MEWIITLSPNFILTVLLFTVSFLCLIAKLYLLSSLTIESIFGFKFTLPFFFLLGIILSSAFIDITWLVRLIKTLAAPFYPRFLAITLVRLSWCFNIVQYLSIGILIDILRRGISNVSLKKYLIFVPLICLEIIYVIKATADKTLISGSEATIYSILSLFIYFFFLAPVSILSLININSSHFSKIARNQIKIFVLYFVFPFLFFEIAQYLSFFAQHLQDWIQIFSDIIITSALFYSTRKIIGLRFLNFHEHVQSPNRFGFIDDFRETLDAMLFSENRDQLMFVAKQFFAKTFKIIPGSVHIYFIDDKHPAMSRHMGLHYGIDRKIIEQLWTALKGEISETNTTNNNKRILIYDEIVYSEFYKESSIRRQLIVLLDALNADVLLPIFHNQSLLGYLIIERNARQDQLYSDLDRDEMIVFANYVATVLYLLKTREDIQLMIREKQLKEELKAIREEIEQYKEVFTKLIDLVRVNSFGVILYKSGRFIPLNDDARSMLPPSVYSYVKHPVFSLLSNVLHQSQKYQAAHVQRLTNAEGHHIIATALPEFDDRMQLVTLARTSIGDLMSRYDIKSVDISDLSCLISLETTPQGVLINRMFPGTSATMMRFKVQLFKLIITNKSIAIESVPDDFSYCIEFIKRTCIRKKVHVIDLNAPVRDSEYAIKLFGLSGHVGTEHNSALFSQLTNGGVIIIKNMHFLDQESQMRLGEYIRHGVYRPLRSTQTIESSVRIICIIHGPLEQNARLYHLDQMLFDGLQHSVISLPDISAFSQEELSDIVDGMSAQIADTESGSSVAVVTEHDKRMLTEHPVHSFTELREKVRRHTLERLEDVRIIKPALLVPNLNESNDSVVLVGDFDLTEVMKQGKRSLKDPKAVKLLWKAFGSQADIAKFLGVNRSTVSRWCRFHNIQSN